MGETSVDISVKGKWISVPALQIDDNIIIVKGKWLKTAVIEAEEWLETEIDSPESCIRKLKEHGSGKLRADIFAFSQKIPDSVPRYSYPLNYDSYAFVHVTSFDEWWTKLPQESRKNVRRSQKRGVTVSVRVMDDRLVQDLVGLNNDSPIRQGKRFTHYGKSFDQVKKDQMSFLDRSDYICAYAGDELIGVLKLVYRGESASILTLLSKASHADKRPSNALLAKAVELCEAKGILYLIYGKLNYGNKRNSSLRDFKIRHGFKEILMPRYHVPLTLWGALCVKSGLHSGPLGVLPPSVIAVSILVRSKCYSLWQAIRRCSSTVEQSKL
jgi:hypothetical protein